MTRKNVIPLIIFSFLLLNSARGQEIVSGLQAIKELKHFDQGKLVFKSKGPLDTLELPLFDDFSQSLIYPDDSLWSDNEVYINNTYPVSQLSTGVATFDALNSSGLLYDHASSIRFEADHLTSNPINLEGGAGDDFYLSFFYQPQGFGDQPELADSLTLQFYSVDEELWYSVWKVEGSEVHPFKPVIIRIDDPRFTDKGFKFRFINYASLSSTINDPAMIGNADHWHIDYIFLDRGRHSTDTVMRDVAFTESPRSILLNYEAMPWEQFKARPLSEMGDSLHALIINNDTTVRNVTRELILKDIYIGSTVYTTPSPVARNIDPGESFDFGAPITYTFSSATEDSALFEITTTLLTDVFDRKVNDTIRYQQVFKNYYAVDDGTAENGYGITSNNSMAVYRYYTSSPDTLRAINICFNDSYQNANQVGFDLVVLSSDNQAPGDIIYSQEEEMVDPGESINGFITYRLDEPVYINGDFFVGWRQRSSTFLSAGLDMNTPAEGRQYYYLNGSWFTSQVGGSLMIRPVVGKAFITTGIEEFQEDLNRVDIWPNPVTNLLYINDPMLSPGDGSIISIYNSAGSLVWSEQYSESLNLSRLSEGVYLMVISKDGLVYSRNKFIRSR